MYSFVLASVAVVAIRHINAQNLGDLPVCAVSILSGIGLSEHFELTDCEQQVAASAAIIQTGCAITDIACVCRGGQFLTALLRKECEEPDQRGELSPSGYHIVHKLCGGQ